MLVILITVSDSFLSLSSPFSLSKITITYFANIMMELLLQEVFLTAFVALVFSFLIAKLVSVAVSVANGDHVESGKTGPTGNVKLDKGLKVEGAKSKMRVRFAVDEVVEKVEKFSGEEGLVGGLEEFCGNKGGDLGIGLEEKRGEGIVEDKELGRVIGSGGELRTDEIVDEQSGEVVRVLEELGVEEKRENLGGDEIVDELVVNSALDELVFTERNESEVGGYEESVRFGSDDVIGDQSGEARVLEELVVEERGEISGLEGDSVNIVSDELIVAEKNENENADDNKSVEFCCDDVGGSLTGELKELVELVVEERTASKETEGNIVNAGLEEKNENVEVDDEKHVGLVSDDVVGEQTGEVRVLKDLISEEASARSVKEVNVLNYTADELVVDKTIENEVAGIETRVKLASEGVVGDGSGEVRILAVREDQGTGVGEELDKVNEKGEGLVSDDDDDWEGIERSDLEKVFATAASYVESGGKDDRLLNLGSDVQMQLYGLHKVAMEGPCYEAQPMALKVSARAKWNAWQRLGNMSPEVAMEQYVSLLSDKDPGWMQGHPAVDGKPESSEVASSGVPETSASTFLDKQTNSMEMNLEPKFDKDGSDLTGSSNSLDADN